MGTQLDDGDSDEPPTGADSIDDLLHSTGQGTEAVVEQLRESGPRRHVSEESVDDVLAEIATPQPEATERDGFALTGGPTRTISTTGIDEVFEQLEAETEPPAPTATADGPEPDNHTHRSSAPLTAITDESPTFEELEAETDDDTLTLSGGPTRTVSDRSVDDILDLVDGADQEPETPAPAEEDPTDASALRPADPEAAMASLVSEGIGALPEAATEPGDDEPVRPSESTVAADGAEGGETESASPVIAGDDSDPLVAARTARKRVTEILSGNEKGEDPDRSTASESTPGRQTPRAETDPHGAKPEESSTELRADSGLATTTEDEASGEVMSADARSSTTTAPGETDRDGVGGPDDRDEWTGTAAACTEQFEWADDVFQADVETDATWGDSTALASSDAEAHDPVHGVGADGADGSGDAETATGRTDECRSSRPLVSEAELEEIASLITDAEAGHDGTEAPTWATDEATTPAAWATGDDSNCEDEPSAESARDITGERASADSSGFGGRTPGSPDIDDSTAPGDSADQPVVDVDDTAERTAPWTSTDDPADGRDRAGDGGSDERDDRSTAPSSPARASSTTSIDDGLDALVATLEAVTDGSANTSEAMDADADPARETTAVEGDGSIATAVSETSVDRERVAAGSQSANPDAEFDRRDANLEGDRLDGDAAGGRLDSGPLAIGEDSLSLDPDELGSAISPTEPPAEVSDESESVASRSIWRRLVDRLRSLF